MFLTLFSFLKQWSYSGSLSLGDPSTAWIITDYSVSSFSQEIKDRSLHFVQFHQYRLKLLVEVAAATCNVSALSEPYSVQGLPVSEIWSMQ